MTADVETMFRSLQMGLAAHRPDVRAHEEVDADADGGSGNNEAVPVTIVTGFLGAGKTTLLAALLRRPPEGRTVRAVVNDVGELGLDPSLLVGDAAVDVELSNGCGCCAINDDLAGALERMARDRPSVLVLEASGVTDPFAIAQIVEASPNLTLDRIVAVVDALLFTDGRMADRADALRDPLTRLGPIVQRQLDASEAVVLSRADLIEPRVLESAMATLADLLPGRTIAPSSLDRPAVDVLLPGSLRGSALPVATAAPNHAEPTDHIVARSFEQRHSISRSTLDDALATRPDSVLRCKGIVTTDAGQLTVQVTASGVDVVAADLGSADRLRLSGGTDATPTLGRITIVATDGGAAERLAHDLGA